MEDALRGVTNIMCRTISEDISQGTDLHQDTAREMFTISGISKFGEIVKTLLGLVGIERFHQVLEGIVDSSRHSVGFVGADLEHRKEKY